MIPQHPKRPCRCVSFIKHGGKRRQCSNCRRTWTVRPKRRGRKRFRASPDIIERYFSKNIPTIRILACRSHWGRDRAQQMVQRSLVRYTAANRDAVVKSLPDTGPLIAIADAIWHSIHGERLTIYLILLRPVASPDARIMLPVFVRGHENRPGWEHAWAQLPTMLRRRICALVCDGHVGLVAFGYRQKWIVQRCHFHLLANLQMYLGTRDYRRNLKVCALVRALITTMDSGQASQILSELAELRTVSRSRGMRRVLSGLQANYQDFQSYLRHPEFNLPTTTNAAESCVSGVRELMRRCRGFRSEKALQLWVTGHVLWKKIIRCNGKHPQN